MLKNNFNKLSLKEKIKLYTIVVITFTISFVLLQNYIVSLKTTIKTKQKEYTILSLEDKITTKTSEDILKYIETNLDSSNITIELIKTTEQTIILEISDSFNKIAAMLHKLEQHLVIEEFLFSKDEFDVFLVNCRVVFLSKYFINKDNNLAQSQKIKNPFCLNKEIKPTKIEEKIIAPKKQKNPIVDAIVGDEVFMEQQWYKKDDIFQEYKIIAIKPNQIKLLNQKTQKITILKVQNDEI